MMEIATRGFEDSSNVINITKCKILHHQSVRDAGGMLQNALSKFSRTENSVVILQSHLKFDHLLQILKVAALHQFPIITLDCPESDDYYDDARLWCLTLFENPAVLGHVDDQQ
jgi:hypothetical protein